MKFPSSRSWCRSALASGCLLLVQLPITVEAAALTSWTQTNGTNSSNLNTSSPILGNGSSGSANSQAIYASFTSFTLANAGDAVTFSGSVSFTNLATPGTDQFRLGIYNVNGKTNEQGWLGYLGSNSGNSAPQSGRLWERNNPNTYSYGSASGATQVASANAAPSNTSFVTGTYSFSLTATRTAADYLQVNFSLTGTNVTYALSISYLDTTPQTFVFNRVGIFTGSLLNADQASFSNLSVSTVPEPATLGLSALAAIVLLKIRRRRKI